MTDKTPADSPALTALLKSFHLAFRVFLHQGYDLGRKEKHEETRAFAIGHKDGRREGLREAARLARLAGGLPGYPIGDEFHAFAEQLDFLAGAV